MARSIFNIRVVFAVLVALAFGYSVYEARSYGYLARIFPLYISLAMFLLALLNIGLELRSGGGPNEEGKGPSLVDLGSNWDMPMGQVWRRFGLYLSLFLSLYVGTWLVGYSLSITVFLILFYKYVTGVKWRWSLVAGAAGLAFVHIVARLLVVDWPQGILAQWIEMPWPFG